MNRDNAKDYLPLVQALAEGKVIQLATTNGEWRDHLELDFSLLPQEYRIKPEPREIWINSYPNEVSCGIYLSKEEAIQRRANDTAKQVRYREVLE